MNCPACGHGLSPGSPSCPECGRLLNAVPGAAAAPAASAPRASPAAPIATAPLVTLASLTALAPPAATDPQIAPAAEVGIVPPAAATPPAAEERRVVTTLFCDLVGSTTLAGRLDPEALRAVTLRYFDVMRELIQARGGLVEKFIGDAVMAVFGFPAIHEDDALQALAAALDMMAALDELNADLDRAFGIHLEVRIGVNTGEVVAPADATSGQALVSGEVVNVAARLQQHASPGHILIGPDTLRTVRNAAVVTDCGSLSLRGKAQPVPAYRLLGLLGDAPELTRRFDTPFVGRKTELEQLDLILARARDTGESHLVTIYGDAGIGKTRLAREWLAQTSDSPVLPGVGRCRPFAESGTLAPLADVLQQLLHGSERPDVLASAFAVLDSGLLQDGTPNPSAEDTCAAITKVLPHLARGRTLVIVIDDCQWASSTLLDIIDQIHLDLAFEPLTLICLSRPDLLHTRPTWGGGRLNSSSLVLAGLSAQECSQLAAGLGEVVAHGSGPQGSVLERAEGNPLYLEHLIDALEQTGEAEDLPLTLQALLSARVSGLHPCQRTMLQIAAVIGRDFSVDDVLHLLDQEPGRQHPRDADDHRRQLRDLVQLRLIEPERQQPGSSVRYRFSSGLIHDTIYQGMVKRIRADRHERVARLGKASGAAPAVIGTHLESAHRYRVDLGLVDARTESLREAAAAALAKAGAAARARADMSWAESLFERALALTPCPARSWADRARQTGEVRLARGRIAEARDLLRQVLSTATAAGDTRTAMHVRLDLASIDPEIDVAAMAGLARQSLVVFSAARDRLGIARAAIRVAQERQSQGRHAEAMHLLTRALGNAVRAEAEPERAMALGALGVSLWQGPVHAAEAIRRGQALLAEHSGRRAVRMSLSCPLAVLHALQDDFAAAAQLLAVAADLGRSTGHADVAVFVPLFTATVETLAGHDEQAESQLRQAMASADAVSDTGMLTAIQLGLARVLMGRGADTEAGELIGTHDTALAMSVAADACGVKARIAARRGDEGGALLLAGEALAAARRTDSPALLATAHLDRAHVLARLGHRHEAGRAATRAAAVFRRKGHVAGSRWAGSLLSETGQP